MDTDPDEDAYLARLADESAARQGNRPCKPLSQVLDEYAARFGEDLRQDPEWPGA